jgi:hypothetical protein
MRDIAICVLAGFLIAGFLNITKILYKIDDNLEYIAYRM